MVGAGELAIGEGGEQGISDIALEVAGGEAAILTAERAVLGVPLRALLARALPADAIDAGGGPPVFEEALIGGVAFEVVELIGGFQVPGFEIGRVEVVELCGGVEQGLGVVWHGGRGLGACQEACGQN